MVTLRILGECAIEVGKTRLGPDSQVLFATLLYLALDRGRRVPRQEMTDTLWPGAGEGAARHNLRQAVYRLRQLGATIDTDGGHLAAPAASVRAPHEALATEAGVDAIFSREAPPIGPVLPGYASGLSHRLDEWVDQQRTLIHGRIRRALVSGMERHRARGRWGEVEVLARKLLAIDPLNEEATLVLAESAAISGSKQYALSILDRYLEEIGPDGRDIRLPAAVLRRRISERLPDPRWRAVSEAAFVGRADSMELLGRLLQGARNGEGGGVLLWGEPGIGKSRLAEELWKVAALQANTQLAKVCCQPSDARRPLSAFADVVPELQKLPGALGCSPRSLALLRRLTEYDVNAEGPSEDAREAEYLYASIKRSIFDLVDAVQEDQCVVLLLEDVHWLDAESWKILREMIPWAARRRLLFVLTSRTPHATDAPDEETPKFLVKHRVGPIDADAAVTLVELMVRERERVPDEAFRDWSVSVAEGNPFFLRELTTYWLQTGAAYQVPASLQALIDDRLDRLPADSLRLLQAVAVLGPHATIARIDALLELPPSALVAAASEIDAAGMIIARDDRIAVKHELLAQACIQRAGTLALKLLHRQAALVLEAEGSTNAAWVWECAAHWEAAGDRARSLACPFRTARHLVELGLPQQAADILSRLRKLNLAPADQADLLSELGQALCLAGAWSRAIEALESAQVLRQGHARHTNAPHSDAILLLDAYAQVGADKTKLLREACALAFSHGTSVALKLHAGFHAVLLADTCGAFGEMRHVFQHVDVLEPESELEHATKEHIRVIFHSACGDPETALDSARRLVGIHDSRPSPPSVRARAHFALTSACLRAGDRDGAMRIAEDCAVLAGQYSIPFVCVAPLLTLATWLTTFGRIDEADTLLDEAEIHLDKSEQRAWSEEFDFARARIALARGDKADARARLLPFEGLLHSDPLLRRRVNIQAAWLQLLLIEGSAWQDAPFFEDFRQTFDALAAHGNMDYPAIVLAALMRARSRSDYISFAEAYVRRQRRELGPPPAALLTMTEKA